MEKFARKLVTVITEAAIETLIIQDLGELGVQGYTVSDVRGKGHRGVRNSAWDLSSNIRIEVVCDEATADQIMEHLKEHYYNNYAMIIFESDVSVLRAEKF